MPCWNLVSVLPLLNLSSIMCEDSEYTLCSMRNSRTCNQSTTINLERRCRVTVLCVSVQLEDITHVLLKWLAALMEDQTDYRSDCSKHSVTFCSNPGPCHCILIDCLAREVEMVQESVKQHETGYLKMQGIMLMMDSRESINRTPTA